jgi:carotenoid cleavage dioxygenase
MFQTAPAGCPVRLVIDLKKQELIARQSLTYCCSPDFPALDPRRAMECYDDFWVLGISSTGGYGRKFFDHLAHVSWQEDTANDIYQAPAMQYLAGEPTYIADPASKTGGAIVCQCFNAETGRNSFLLFEAQHVFKGPMAVLNIDRPVHLGFHAVFVPASE